MAEKTTKAKDVSESTVADMARHWHRTGRPERANALKRLFREGEPIPYQLLDKVGVKSEKDIEGELEVPPRGGEGSGVKNWRKFAAQVSDMDKAVLDKMERAEIIEILEQREIIPTVEEENEDKESE